MDFGIALATSTTSWQVVKRKEAIYAELSHRTDRVVLRQRIGEA